MEDKWLEMFILVLSLDEIKKKLFIIVFEYY